MKPATIESSNPLSLAFIGGGLTAAVGQAHFSAIHMDGLWRLDAGAFSRNRDTNRQTAAAWNVSYERIYADWRNLLKNEYKKIDAVVVLTPTPDHAQIVSALLEQNIPVICEKALATNLEELELLKALAIKNQAFLVVTYNYTGYPMIRELRALIDKGRLGRIQQIHLEMPQEGFVRPPDIAGQASKPQSWRLQDGDTPTICLDLADHLQHMVHFLMGNEPIEVMADYSNYSEYPQLVDNATIWIRYDDGIKAAIWISKTAIGHRNGLKVRVFGDQGSAEWVQMQPEELSISLRDGSRLILDRGSNVEIARAQRYNRFKVGHPAGFIEAYANLYTDIAISLAAYRNGINHSNPYVFDCSHAARGLKIFAAANRSNTSRSWQSIE